jgi:hypothetical protein
MTDGRGPGRAVLAAVHGVFGHDQARVAQRRVTGEEAAAPAFNRTGGRRLFRTVVGDSLHSASRERHESAAASVVCAFRASTNGMA